MRWMPASGMKFLGSPFSKIWPALTRKTRPRRGLGLGLVQEQNDAGRGGVVEEVLGQVEDALDQVVVDEPLADGLLLVGAGIARAAGGGAGVEDDGGAAFVVEAGVHVLHPAPVGGGFAGEAGPGGEAVELVVVVVGLGEPVLVPHGIGDDAVEGAQFAACQRNLGFLKVSPISISPSKSWMIRFMLAMAQVSAMYSWP
jgi:hypothetical protein